jgi:hypothetical protein
MRLSSEVKNGFWVIVLVVAAIAAVMLLVAFGLRYLLCISDQDMIRLPILAIVGVMALLFCMAVISVAFASMNLSDKTQALALPEGSVRAVIALCLIVLFAIMTIFLFRSMSDPATPSKVFTGLTQDGMKGVIENNKDLICVVVPYEKKKEQQIYRVECHEKVDDDAKARQRAKEDFAKQLLILIGTLVTAVSSFYFGTRAGASTQADSRATGTLGSIDPPTAPAGSGPLKFTLRGNNLDLVREVKLVSGSDEVIGTEVSSNAEIVKFTASFAKVEKGGQWDVVATDANQRVLKLRGALKVTDAAQATTTAEDNPPKDTRTDSSIPI